MMNETKVMTDGIKCKVCGSTCADSIKLTFRGKYAKTLKRCSSCSLLFVPNPSWLEEAYSDNSINLTDTGLIHRNYIFRNFVVLLILFNIISKKIRILDFAGGYGVFVKLLRDLNIQAYWSDQYTENIFASNFEYKEQEVDFITAFEAIEHLEEPLSFFNKIAQSADYILFSTTTINEVPNSNWWYYGLHHGQHITFYTPQALQVMAKSKGYYFYSYKYFHFFSKKKINSTIFKMIALLSMIISYDYLYKFSSIVLGKKH